MSKVMLMKELGEQQIKEIGELMRELYCDEYLRVKAYED